MLSKERKNYIYESKEDTLFYNCMHNKRGDMNSNKIFLELTGANIEIDDTFIKVK